MNGLDSVWRAALGATMVVALLAGLLTITAAPARAATGSIVFTRDHNVWIMAADDPSTATPVTTDGTAEAPYLAPTQDDSGRILAVAGGEGGDIVRMDQQGTLLGDPFRPPDAGNFVDLDVRADGDVFTHTSYRSYDTVLGFVVAPTVDFAYADGRDPSDIANPAFDEAYATYSTDTTFMTSYDDDLNATVATYGPDDAEPQDWFMPCESAQSSVEDDYGFCFPTFADVTTAEDRVAVAVPGYDGGPVPSRLWVFDMPGPAPTAPTWGCELLGPELTQSGDFEFQNPEWSPDGSALVYEYYAEPAGGALENGIYVASGFDAGCEDGFATAELVLPGGSYPDWSAAPFGASPPPSEPPPPTDPPPSPSPSPPPPSGLVDGGRLDGGGAQDPVGQTIATSRMLFGDGEASRVVLATADRFPDALAGAALAGDDGPILLTSGLGDLDPRVGAEIARVTGGAGVVLTLGGTHAVSDAAAAQARAAGGDSGCAAPLPGSCRYAGTGREHTAALIAGTVLAEHPGSVALVARGDEFADAITGGAYAAASGTPILLTPSNQVNVDTAAFLTANGVAEVVVLGGEVAIDDPTYNGLPVASRSRVRGPERTATAAAIAQELWGGAGLGAGGVVLVNVRHAEGWQTALSAAVASAVFDAPQLGVENPPAAVGAETQAVLGANAGPVMAFGSPDLVSDAQLGAAVAATP
ncbi:MAG: cell wall-binding repeat-containing protein [Euzebyaceae bacterium]|nr:cell wall-binding repeat-containing protein [Euzebyaceae bacterium]